MYVQLLNGLAYKICVSRFTKKSFIGLDQIQQSKLDHFRAEENVCTVMKWPSLQNKCEQIHK